MSSIKIRVEAIHYFLQRYAEDMVRKSTAALQIENNWRNMSVSCEKNWSNRKRWRRCTSPATYPQV